MGARSFLAPLLEEFMPITGPDIVVIALVVLVILVLFAGIKTVPQGYRYTIERFGRYTRTLEPGLNIIMPFSSRHF